MDDDRNPLCHRCRQARVRVYGMQCTECQKITDHEYWAERERRGGKLLYLEGVDMERVAEGMSEEIWDDPEALDGEKDTEEEFVAKPFGAPRGGARGDPQRYAAIIALASEGKESYTQIGQRFGIGAERVRQIVAAGPGFVAARTATTNGNGPHCSKCKKPFTPATHGWAKTTCRECRVSTGYRNNTGNQRALVPSRPTAAAHAVARVIPDDRDSHLPRAICHLREELTMAEDRVRKLQSAIAALEDLELSA